MLARRPRSAAAKVIVAASILLVSAGTAFAAPREVPSAPSMVPVHLPPVVTTELATFAAAGCTGGCGSGSTIGPDHALYVTDGKGGRVLRIDPRTGAQTTYAHGLPRSIDAFGIGGAMDVAFIGPTAYVLVTLVGPELGQPDVVDGIYRIRRDGTATPIADLGAWSTTHPPAGDIFVASGVQYALQPFRGGFLVTDGHHNRVLRVGLDGKIDELIAFGDVVPTGLDVRGGTIYLGEAGPLPHLPETGKVVSFTTHSHAARTIASGARLIVDVEFGARGELYVLSQGIWDLPNQPDNAGLPASPNTGSLLRLNRSGSFTKVAGPLDRPTSVELIGHTALVVTLTGKVIRIDGIPPYAGR